MLGLALKAKIRYGFEWTQYLIDLLSYEEKYINFDSDPLKFHAEIIKYGYCQPNITETAIFQMDLSCPLHLIWFVLGFNHPVWS